MLRQGLSKPRTTAQLIQIRPVQIQPMQIQPIAVQGVGAV
jgi:hypothetical protein